VSHYLAISGQEEVITPMPAKKKAKKSAKKSAKKK
jgi:hypothetical protein